MSRENVEVVERAARAFQDGGLDAALRYLDPEIVWEDLDTLPGASTARGHEELRSAFARFFEAWGELSFELEATVDAGDEVIVAHHWHGSGRSSGTPVDTTRWNLFTVRDGRIVRRRAFATLDEARRATGLRP